MQGRDETFKGTYERWVGEGREREDMTAVTTSASPDPRMERHGHTTVRPVGNACHMAPGSTERAADLQTGARDHLKGEKQGSQTRAFKHKKGEPGASVRTHFI